MRSDNHDHGRTESHETRRQVATSGCIAVIAFASLFGATAFAQSTADIAADAHMYAEASICQLYGCNGSSVTSGPARPAIDPCFIAQNALRPCTAPQAKGVDPKIVGTWELAQKHGSWVLEIHPDGTYSFHSEARDGTAPNSGTFSTSDGHWSLTATTGYADGGSYRLEDTNTWIATGRLGSGTWRRRSQSGSSN